MLATFKFKSSSLLSRSNHQLYRELFLFTNSTNSVKCGADSSATTNLSSSATTNLRMRHPSSASLGLGTRSTKSSHFQIITKFISFQNFLATLLPDGAASSTVKLYKKFRNSLLVDKGSTTLLHYTTMQNHTWPLQTTTLFVSFSIRSITLDEICTGVFSKSKAFQDGSPVRLLKIWSLHISQTMER